MNYILILDTANTYLSLAILDETSKLLYSFKDSEKQNHAKKITTEIDNGIRSCGIEINQIKYIAVNSGPGSFTGLRVGVSSAKGLAVSTKANLISLCGLEEYALEYYQAEEITKPIAFLKDARRQNFFYTIACDNKVLKKVSFAHFDEIKRLSSEYGVEKIIEEKDKESFLNAKNLINATIRKINTNDLVGLEDFVPSYFLNTYVK